jgi:glycosyltransferase involved in cell wall biosynthesis
MTIWDLTRLHWLSRPQYSGDRELTKWLQESHFDLWGYLPIDALGPGGRLSSIAADALQGFSRLLTYTRWAKVAVNATLGDLASEARNLDWMPHGIDFNAWGLMDKDEAKKGFYPFLHHGEHLVGAIGTNQARKDWGLVAQTCRLIAEQRKDVKFWWHSDLPERHWSFNSLLYDFGLQSRVKITYQMTGQELNTAYNACDLTLHPGLGEGFGYPIFESLACGTPILHGDYGGGADLLFTSGYSGSMVRPESFRVEGVHNQVRPVFSPKDWADMALDVLGEDSDRERLRASISHLAWANLWPLFEQWFEKGVRNG